MKKQLVIITMLLLLLVNLSGCNEKQEVIKEQEEDVSELTPTNLVIKNITYSPKFPVEKDEIIFTIEVENTVTATIDRACRRSSTRSNRWRSWDARVWFRCPLRRWFG